MSPRATIQAVVLAADPDQASERGVAGVQARRALALQALDTAARLRGACLGPFAADTREAPVPSNGWHWSISHARRVAAAVVHHAAVGIDVEEIAERRDEIVRLVLSPIEEALFGGFSWLSFTRAWTAKEAVLKGAGVGLAELSRCTLARVISDQALVVSHRGALHQVSQVAAHDHVIAVCAFDAEDLDVQWTIDVAHAEQRA